ncbi:hypothetical protein KC318_g1614 [Hortaea werneckii]|nr:hypothetical protein KC324_g5872 [Hortaea werneckii]KAI7589924.1 hypothetical protein KC316_g3669 [Hortaea werneckii]KAI7674392.1 hypothetical protein KC318_g1614 [Hortaea werneckii]
MPNKSQSPRRTGFRPFAIGYVSAGLVRLNARQTIYMVLENLSVNLPRATSSQPGPAVKPAHTPSTSNATLGNAGSPRKGPAQHRRALGPNNAGIAEQSSKSPAAAVGIAEQSSESPVTASGIAEQSSESPVTASGIAEQSSESPVATSVRGNLATAGGPSASVRGSAATGRGRRAGAVRRTWASARGSFKPLTVSEHAAERARLERQQQVEVQPSGRKSTSPIAEEDELLSVAEKPGDGVLSLGSAPDMKRKKKTGSAASVEEVVYKPSDRMSKIQAPRLGAANVNRSNGGVPVPAVSSHVLEAGGDSDDEPLRKKAKTASVQAGDVDGEGGVPVGEPRRNPTRRGRAQVVEAPASLQSGPQRARGKGKGKAKEPSPEPEESESESSEDDELGSEDEESEFEGPGDDEPDPKDEEYVGDDDIDPEKELQEQLDDEVADEESGDEESDPEPQPEPRTSRRVTRATAAPTPIAKAQAKKRGRQRLPRNAARFEGVIDVGLSADKISPLTPEQREQGLAEFDQDARHSLEARRQLAQDVANEVVQDSPMTNAMVDFYLDNDVDLLIGLLKKHISEDRRAVIGRREADADEVFARLPAPTEEELSQAFCYLGRLVSKGSADIADESPEKVIYSGSASSPKPFGGFSRWRQYLSVRKGTLKAGSYWTRLLVRQKYRPQLRMVAGMDKIQVSPVVVAFLEGFLVDFFETIDEAYEPEPGSNGELYHKRAYIDAWKAAVPPRRKAFAAHSGANHAHPLKQGVARNPPRLKYIRYVLEFKCPVEVCDNDRTGLPSPAKQRYWRRNQLSFVHARYICSCCHMCMKKYMRDEKLDRPSQIDEVKFNSARQKRMVRGSLGTKQRTAKKQEARKNGICYGCSAEGIKATSTVGLETNPWPDLVEGLLVCHSCVAFYNSRRANGQDPAEIVRERRAFVAGGGRRHKGYHLETVQNLTCYAVASDGHKPHDDLDTNEWVKWESGDDKLAFICKRCHTRTMRGYQTKGSPIDRRSKARKLQDLRAAWEKKPW